MKKVIRDGKVAVLYSPGFGAGWFNANSPIEAVFHPRLVELVENDERDKITEELVKELFGITFYIGGAYELKIEWIKEGTEFSIEEYDGSESIRYKDSNGWLKA